MDPSSRLAYVLGKIEVKAEELCPEDWLVILKAALGICRPYLKYLSGFEEINKALNFSQGAYNDRITDLSLVKFPDELGLATRCLLLARLLSHGVRENQGPVTLSSKQLLLTQSGEWVFWYAKYNRTIKNNLGFLGYRSGTRETAIASEFTLLDDDRLLEVLQAYPDKPPGILHFLFLALHRSVEEKRKHLQFLEISEGKLAGLVDRAGAQCGVFNCTS